ncbi:MAG TPA: glycosyltransferase family 4 protein [Stellaceae bacterium]
MTSRKQHLLHVFASFGIGGVPLRMARIINHFGVQLRHTIVALDHNFAAAREFTDHLEVALLPPGEARRGMIRSLGAAVSELRRLRPDLLITYNWGAIEWAMANRLFPIARQLHFEAGFGKEEATSQLRRRVLFRRWALARAAGVVVPSRRLEELARRVWKLPLEQVVYVPNGVDVARFADPPRDRVPGFSRRPGELVVGTVAPLRPEKNIGRLLRAFASLEGPPTARLIIAGEGSERPALVRLAAELGLGERVVFTGQVAAEAVLGTFDVFALSSDTEQMPNALLEAMAARRAVAAVDVGDVRDMVCEANRGLIVACDDGRSLADAISRLLRDPAKRTELAHGNRRRAVEMFSQERMFTAYSHIFGLDHGI